MSEDLQKDWFEDGITKREKRVLITTFVLSSAISFIALMLGFLA